MSDKQIPIPLNPGDAVPGGCDPLTPISYGDLYSREGLTAEDLESMYGKYILEDFIFTNTIVEEA